MSAVWYCTRQRAGPLVKECRSLRPPLGPSVTRQDASDKRQLRKGGHSAVCRSQVDRLELRLAMYGFEGSHYTCTYDFDHLPRDYDSVRKYFKAFRSRIERWRKKKPYDWVACIEGRHGDHRYHVHLVLRDSQLSPAEVRYLWRGGDVDDEPLLRGRGDSYRRIARYMLKEPTDGITIPIGKRVCRWSQSLNEKLPAAERFWAERDTIRIPKTATSHGSYQTQNEFGSYKFAWYIKK